MKTLISTLFFLLGFNYLNAQNIKYAAQHPEVKHYHHFLDSSTSQKNTTTKTTAGITFKEVQSFGSNQETIIGEISDFAVDEKNRVLIADMDQTTVHVFGSNGDYITSLGRQGNGPAEFSAVTPNTTVSISSSKLYVTDYTGAGNFYPSRVQIFNLGKDLSFLKTVKLIPQNLDEHLELKGYYPDEFYPRSKGGYLVSFKRPPNRYTDSKSYIRYVVLDSTGTIIDGTVLKQQDRQYLTYFVENAPSPYLAIHDFQFLEQSLFAMSGKDKLFTARSMDFAIDVHDSVGNYLRSFQHSIKNQTLTKSSLIERYKNRDMSDLGEGIAVKMIRNAENLPNQWPVLDRMFFDDHDRLWVATIAENRKIYQWWVFEYTGEVVTKFKWPRKKVIKTVKNEFLYTIEKDEDGIAQIIKYKFKID